MEKTITVEITASEGIYLVDAISARLDQLVKGGQKPEAIQEFSVLYSIIMKIDPQVRNMAAQEKANR